MADRIETKFMSYDDWKDLGPLFHEKRNENEIYDGTTRPDPTTPNYASLYVGGPNKLLGNPNHSSRNDSFTNAHSQWMHIGKALSKGGDEAFKLVHAATKEAHKMSEISERKHGDADAWVAVGPDAETAKVIRGFVTATLKYFPPAKGAVQATLPRKSEPEAFDAAVAGLMKDMDSFRPKRFRKRTLQDGQVLYAQPDSKEAGNDREFHAKVQFRGAKNAPRQFAGAMAIISDDGMEQAAAAYVRGLDARLLACPEKNKALWDALSANRPAGAFYPRNYDASLKQNQAAEQLIDRSDAAVFFVNGDPKSRATSLLAYASRTGKAVIVAGPNEEKMDVFAASLEAEQVHMSKKEIAQSYTSEAFDRSASDPLAYLALSKIKNEKIGKITDKDIARMAGMGETINEIADIASNPNGQSYLLDEIKITPAAIKLLASKSDMARARDNFLKITADISSAGLEVIGPDSYSETLRISGHFEPYMIAEGNLDLLANPGKVVGISGASTLDKDAGALTGRKNAKAVAALAAQPVTTAYVLGQTSEDIPLSGPQIVISTVGKAHLPEQDKQKLEAVIENGGAVIHMQPPTYSAHHYDPNAINPETGKKGMTVSVPARMDRVAEARAAKLLGAISNTVLVTAINAKDPESTQHATVRTQLSTGRLPTIVNFNDYQAIEHVSGNRALITGRGPDALVRAGFGSRDSETLGQRYAGAPVSIDTGKNVDVAMTNLSRHLNGQDIQLPVSEKTKRREKQAEQI